MSKRVDVIVTLTANLNAKEIVLLQSRLTDLWGNNPEMTGTREPRRPILPSRPSSRARKKPGAP